MHRTRIMFVIHDMTSGGAERIINNIVWHFDRNEFDIHLVLHRMDIVFSLPEDLTSHNLDLYHPWQVPRAIKRLRGLINDIQPDLLISGALNPALLCAEAVRTMTNRPQCVAIIVNNPQLEPGWRQPWARRSYRIIDRFIVLCQDLRSLFLQTYPFVDSDQALVWQSPVDVNRIAQMAGNHPDELASRGSSLIAIGRLCAQKRFDILLDAFAQLRKTQDVDLLIFGEGPMRKKLEEQAARLGIAEAVHMPGFSSNPYPYLSKADICVMSSDFEGMPNVLLEAHALGVPVVSTGCPTGPADIVVDGETGLIVPCANPPALKDALCHLLEDTQLRTRMGKAAAQRARQHFDIPVSISELAAHLRAIASNSASPAVGHDTISQHSLPHK